LYFHIFWHYTPNVDFAFSSVEHIMSFQALMNLPLILRVEVEKNNKSKKSLALVKWCSNLGLTTGIKLYNKEIRKMVSLPLFQISVLIGLLL